MREKKERDKYAVKGIRRMRITRVQQENDYLNVTFIGLGSRDKFILSFDIDGNATARSYLRLPGGKFARGHKSSASFAADLEHLYHLYRKRRKQCTL